MAESAILQAIEQICQEKNISREAVIEAIEHALAAAYRKDFGQKNQNIKVEFNPETGGMKVFDLKTVVEDVPLEEEKEELQELKDKKGGEKGKKKKTKKEKKSPSGKTSEDKGGITEVASPEALIGTEEEKKRFNPRTEIMISEAKKIKKGYRIGDEIKTELPIPTEFGRIAAQTAKQVIVQRLREAERQMIYENFKKLEGQVVNGIVQRRERQVILVDINETTAILPLREQIEEEKYYPGQKIKVYLIAVNETPRGPEIIVSRRHPEIVREIFKSEIPEIKSGAVEIKGVARAAGYRSKVAVWTEEKNLDPVGAAIGQRGVRIQTIITELGGEKVDIIEYSDDPIKFINNALGPAKISSIKIIDQEEKRVSAVVKRNQYSLVIGRGGMNIRLAMELTGWKIIVLIEEEMEETDKKTENEKGEKTTEAGTKKGAKIETEGKEKSEGDERGEKKEKEVKLITKKLRAKKSNIKS